MSTAIVVMKKGNKFGLTYFTKEGELLESALEANVDGINIVDMLWDSPRNEFNGFMQMGNGFIPEEVTGYDSKLSIPKTENSVNISDALKTNELDSDFYYIVELDERDTDYSDIIMASLGDVMIYLQDGSADNILISDGSEVLEKATSGCEDLEKAPEANEDDEHDIEEVEAFIEVHEDGTKVADFDELTKLSNIKGDITIHQLDEETGEINKIYISDIARFISTLIEIQ